MEPEKFKHGEEGTHYVCNKHNIGGKSVCCGCYPKDDCSNEPEKKDVWELFDERFTDNFVWWKECVAEALVGDVDVHALKSFIKTHFISRTEMVEFIKENGFETMDREFDGITKTLVVPADDLLNLLTQEKEISSNL